MEVKSWTKDGVLKERKELVLKAEEAQNEEPRVTLWDNHPQYEEAKVGFEISGTLEKKDSGTPIPAHPEKNFVNRTLLEEQNENGIMKPDIDFVELRRKIEILWRESPYFVESSKEPKTIDYPENDLGESPF